MLRNLKELEHYKIGATDGPIGQVEDFYFEDGAWVVRYLVVDTGSWLSGRKVLISPVAVGQPDWRDRTMPVAITRQQVEASPGIETHLPVSRQDEEDHREHYGYTAYWTGGGLWGAGMYPDAMAPGHSGRDIDRAAAERELAAYRRDEASRHRNDDSRLHSLNAVIGYPVHAIDGDIGRIANFLVDDATWAVRYLVVKTGHWWSDHEVLVAPSWVDGLNGSDRRVDVGVGRESIKCSPPYVSTDDWGREHDLRLYSHYDRSGYWDGRREAFVR